MGRVDGSLEKKKKALDGMSVFNDYLFSVCFEDAGTVEEFLVIVMGMPDLKVRSVVPQRRLTNILNRSVTLDVLAEDSRGNLYNIEVQRDSAGAGARRLRYHGSLLDACFGLAKNRPFDELADTNIIFMTERDVKGLGWFKYEYDYCLRNRPRGAGGTGIPESALWLDTGMRLIIVNGAYKDLATPEGRLAHDFHCTKSEDVLLPRLRRRVHEIKETQEGRKRMYDFMDDMLRDNALATKAAAATRFLSNGALPVEEIARGLELPLEEVLRLKEERDRQVAR